MYNMINALKRIIIPYVQHHYCGNILIAVLLGKHFEYLPHI